MKFTVGEFRNWKQKKVTLLGMSGVGKTYLSALLRRYGWYHYSGDYRIGTRYLDESILDLIKEQAMQVPFLSELLRNDWIYIRNNIKVSDLGPVLSFVGKLGDPEFGGVPLEDFQRRQALYRDAEIAAMYDVPCFIDKAQKIYGYDHFVNDVGGSLCELDEPGVIDLLVEHTLMLYIQVTDADEEQKLIARAAGRTTMCPPDGVCCGGRSRVVEGVAASSRASAGSRSIGSSVSAASTQLSVICTSSLRVTG